MFRARGHAEAADLAGDGVREIIAVQVGAGEHLVFPLAGEHLLEDVVGDAVVHEYLVLGHLAVILLAPKLLFRDDVLSVLLLEEGRSPNP